MVSVVPALRRLAAYTYRRHPVPVVAITGSVGKTTTKDLIADVLASRHSVARSAENFNIEGLPSTLLGIPFTKSSRKALARLPLIMWRVLSPPRPDYFVLEVGTTKPGDILTSLSMFTPTIAVITTFMPAHLEQLGSLDGIVREKSQLVRALPRSGYAVLRYDDERVRELGQMHSGSVVTYGFDHRADVWADQPVRVGKGLSTVLHDADGELPLTFPRLSNEHHLYAVMAAWCVGRIVRIPREMIRDVVQQTGPQAGRGTLDTTPSGTLLMDETWNANPASMRAAFDTFKSISHGRRRVVVLGDMLELGADSHSHHETLGREAADFADVLLAVGTEAEYYVKGFSSVRPEAPHYRFDTVDQAEATLLSCIRPEDALLLKGSHGVHLDKLVARMNPMHREADTSVRASGI